MQNTKNILVAPLNWGLGHATRCIPIVNALQKKGFTPILASDGNALVLLQKEFPNLETIKLPAYGITYPKNGKYFMFRFLWNAPKMLLAVRKERKIVERLVVSKNLKGIISDNRFGVRSDGVPSVYITHQLTVLSGVFTFMSSLIHRYIIKKFDECWIPDKKVENDLSGTLGHLKKTNLKLKYLGVLSRFRKKKETIIYDYLVLLSGPEPQRSILEQKMFSAFKNTSKKVVFVLGKMENEQTCVQKENLLIYNFMLSDELSKIIQKSEVIISRSGYTTIMDLAKLNKKAFFIPTPGQFEQLYLVKRLDKLKIVPFAFQEDFNIKLLEKVSFYEGLKCNELENFNAFFKIFSLY